MFYFFLVTVFIFSCGHNLRPPLFKEKSVESYGKEQNLTIEVDIAALQKKLKYEFNNEEDLKRTLNNINFARRAQRGNTLVNFAVENKIGEIEKYSSDDRHFGDLVEKYKGNEHLTKVANDLGIKLKNNNCHYSHNQKTYGNVVEAILSAIDDDRYEDENINDIVERVIGLAELKPSIKRWIFSLDDFKSKKDIISIFQNEFDEYYYAWEDILEVDEDFAFNLFKVFVSKAFDLYPYIENRNYNGIKNRLSFIEIKQMNHVQNKELEELCSRSVSYSKGKFKESYSSYAESWLKACKEINESNDHSDDFIKSVKDKRFRNMKKSSLSNLVGSNKFFNLTNGVSFSFEVPISSEETKNLNKCDLTRYNYRCEYGNCKSCDKKLDKVFFSNVVKKFPDYEYLFSALKGRADLSLIYLGQIIAKKYTSIGIDNYIKDKIFISSSKPNVNHTYIHSSQNKVATPVEGVLFFENATTYVDRIVNLQRKIEEKELELRLGHNCYSTEISKEVKQELDLFAKSLLRENNQKIENIAKKNSDWLKLKELRRKFVNGGITIELGFKPGAPGALWNNRSDARYKAFEVMQDQMPKDWKKFISKKMNFFNSGGYTKGDEDLKKYFEYIFPGTKSQPPMYPSDESKIVIKGTNK